MKLRRLLVPTVSAALSWCGITRWLRFRRHKRGDFRIFILEFHGVDPSNREWEGTISQTRFRRHLQWLKKRFPLTTVDGAADLLRQGNLDRDWCVITFDDGYLNNVEGAFPVLQQLKVPATIYLTTGFLDGEELWFDSARRLLAACRQPGGAQQTPPWVSETLAQHLGSWPPQDDVETSMARLKRMPAEQRLDVVHHLRAAGLPTGEAAEPMTWDQARRLRDAGIELGAHTVHHPILSRLDRDGQEAEIRGSVERIAEQLGNAPTTFAMPNGSAEDYNADTLEILRRLGLKAACTTRRGSCAVGHDLLELPRLGVGSDTTAVLDARLAGVFDAGMRKALFRFFPFLR